jgi:hypothetical protein
LHVEGNLGASVEIEAAVQQFRCSALTIELQNTVAEHYHLEYILAAVLVGSLILYKFYISKFASKNFFSSNIHFFERHA